MPIHDLRYLRLSRNRTASDTISLCHCSEGWSWCWTLKRSVFARSTWRM